MTKKRYLSLFFIALLILSLLAGTVFFNPTISADASHDWTGTNTGDVWTGKQTTDNLIYVSDGTPGADSKTTLFNFGWRGINSSIHGWSRHYSDVDLKDTDYGWGIQAENTSDNIGDSSYNGGVWYRITLSEADRAKANKGDLTAYASSVNYHQTSAALWVSLKLFFDNENEVEITHTQTTEYRNIFQNGSPVRLYINSFEVPAGTASIRYYVSNCSSLAGRPFIGGLKCTLTDKTAAKAVSSAYVENSTITSRGGAIAGDTVSYSVTFDEKVSVTNAGTAKISVAGTEVTQSEYSLSTANGVSTITYKFTVPSVKQSGTISFAGVTGCTVVDEAGNSSTVSYTGSPKTVQYYKEMTVTGNLTKLSLSGSGSATFGTDFMTTLTPSRGYNLPSSITVSVGGRTLSLGNQCTYDPQSGKITIKGANITDDIVITAAGVAKKSTVTFDQQSGLGGTESTLATYDASMPDITAPSRTGYTFQGYYTQSGEGGTRYYDERGESARNCDFETDIKLYAHWTANKYTIKFDKNKPSNASADVQGNLSDVSRTYDDGNKALPQNSFTLKGWTFQGWAISKGSGVTYANGQEVKNLTSVDGGIYTLYAVWQANRHTITLNAMGGTNAGTLNATYDSAYPSITLPERNGYNFLGYYDSEKGGAQYYNEKGQALKETLTIDDDIELYAQWSPITYTIRLYNDGVFVGDLTDIVFGELTLPSAEKYGLSREHFDFVGWNMYDEQNWAMYYADTFYAVGLTGKQDEIVVLYAAWLEKPIHALFYDANGGSGAPATVQLHEEETIVLSDETPSRDNYTFVGWGLSANTEIASYFPGGNLTMGTDGVTLYAVWKHNPTLSYDANGGDFHFTVADVYPAPASSVKITEVKPVRTGYQFLGWSIDKDAVKADYKSGETFEMPEEDTILYAVWEIGQYTITSVVADGYTVVGLEERYPFGAKATFTVTGEKPKVYINGELAQKGEDGNYSFTVEGDMQILVADGTKLSLVYSANGGSDAPSDNQQYTSSSEATVSSEQPTRTGYSFQGWAEEKNAQEAKYEAGSSIQFSAEEDIVLYAVWKANTYTVVYNAGEGTGTMASDDYSYGTAGTLSENAFEKTGFNFIGWALSNGGECVFKDGDAILNLTAEDGEEVTLYAVWERMKTLLTFSADGGAGGSANFSVEYGDKLPTSGVMAPVRSGYTFGGYFTEKEGKGTKIFDENMQPSDTSPWNRSEQILSLYAYWIPTPETIEKTIDTVQDDLDKAQKELKAAIDENQTDIEGKITALNDAYIKADEVLRTDLSAADEDLKAQIEALKAQMEEAKSTLQSTIDKVQENLSKAKEELQAAIDKNKTDLESEVKKLDDAYKAADAALRSELVGADTALEGKISALEKAMNDADTALEQAIDAVQANLEKAQKELQATIEENKADFEDKVNKLIDAYQAADAVINSKIAALQAQDSEFAKSLSDLDSAYRAADEALKVAIDKVQENLDGAVADLQETIKNNKADIEEKLAAVDSAFKTAERLLRTDMTEADDALQAQIDALEKALQEAQSALQVAIDTVQKNLDKAVLDLQDSIETNKTDIENKVAALDEAFKTAEKVLRADMTAADDKLDAKINALEDAMNNADSALQAAIDTVQNNLDKAQRELQEAIDRNEMDIEAKVAALDEEFKAANALLRSDMIAADEELQAEIDALKKAMKNADTALQKAIDVVEDNLKTAVSNLYATIDGNKIDIEEKVWALNSAYKAAHALLRSDMTAADEELEAKIIAAMNAADAALQSAIDAVQANLDKAVAELKAAIENNETDIEAKVAALNEAYKAADALINSDIAGLKAQDTALANSIAALDSAYKAADEALWNGIRQVEEKHDALKKESERTALIYMIINIVLGVTALALIVTLVVKSVRKKKSQQ